MTTSIRRRAHQPTFLAAAALAVRDPQPYSLVKTSGTVRPAGPSTVPQSTEIVLKDCQLWDGPKFGSGYGAVSVDGYPIATHRLAFAMGHGVDPAGMLVCHKCDNKLCINPDHLFLGTHKDNTQDMLRKGRSVTRRFCKRGHDTWLVGRYPSSRNCRACMLKETK